MSRIEKAIQQALEKRNGVQEGAVPERQSPEVASPSPTQQVSVESASPYLVAARDSDSPVSEDYRKLKSMIIKITKMGKSQNALMVTSAVGGEGKTVTALNLAISLAQEYDHTVLLVDADLRRPSVHDYLGISPGPGLTECLTNGADIGGALIRTDLGNLTVLPAGKRVSNPSELVSSARMREVAMELKHRYANRYIIFDTPPVLLYSEALTIGSMVDGVLMVIGEGKVSQDSLREAFNMLSETKMLGAVYNNASMEALHGYYRRYKSYYKRLGEE